MKTYFATFTVVGILTCVLVGTNGFLFKPTDCLVSEFTEWSDPFGFGQISRERKILRHPSNGGAACPAVLEEVKQTTQKPTLKSTAVSMVNNFCVQAKLRDLLVIVDDSGSVTSEHFATAKTQLSRLLGMLCPEPDPFNSKYQRAALLQYSTTVKEIFDFNDMNSTQLVKQGVMSMAYRGEYTCTATAFDYAHTMFTTA